MELGPLKLVPYLSGEASYYGEDVTGNDLSRLIGQAGIRSTLPMWRVDRDVQSSLLNVRGLAHKVDFVSDLFYADSSSNLEDLPAYDALDDDAQEEFRRRFFFSTFGGALPNRFDPRNFAYRQGLQRYITNPAEVIADDALQARLGLHQRWQTKRGVPGRERIVDLLQFDIDTVLFAKADRDNFGEVIGPTTYDFRYHLGDRVTLLSDGYADWFDDGLRSVSAGVRTSRPGVGDVYLGVMSLEGPISATVLRSSYDYRVNEKWILSAASTYDFGNTGNVGQTVSVTRIGESMLLPWDSISTKAVTMSDWSLLWNRVSGPAVAWKSRWSIDSAARYRWLGMSSEPRSERPHGLVARWQQRFSRRPLQAWAWHPNARKLVGAFDGSRAGHLNSHGLALEPWRWCVLLRASAM